MGNNVCFLCLVMDSSILFHLNLNGELCEMLFNKKQSDYMRIHLSIRSSLQQIMKLSSNEDTVWSKSELGKKKRYVGQTPIYPFICK